MLTKQFILLALFVFVKCDDIVVQIYKEGEDKVDTKITSISELSKLVSPIENINLIEIQDQNIPLLPNHVFHGITVDELDISKDKLQELEPGAFDGATLDRLSFYDNDIKSIKKGVFNKRILSFISFDTNHISEIEDGALEDLTVTLLGLSNNRLTKLTGKTFLNAEISLLRLDNNNITEIEEDTFRNIVNLTSLDLDDNQLESIGKEFTNIPSLSELSLQRNHIKALAPGSFSGSGLTYIYLAENLITEISKGVFNGLPFSMLDFSRNKISKIETGAFEGITTLTYIQLSHNNLGNLTSSSLGGLNVPLQGLSLDNNNIYYIDGTLHNLVAAALDLSGNHLQIIQKDLFQNTEIEVLDLRNNEIVDIEVGAIAEIKNLAYLDLGENRLTAIKTGVFNIPLDLINFESNFITTVEDEALGNVTLNDILLDNNPITATSK